MKIIFLLKKDTKAKYKGAMEEKIIFTCCNIPYEIVLSLIKVTQFGCLKFFLVGPVIDN